MRYKIDRKAPNSFISLKIQSNFNKTILTVNLILRVELSNQLNDKFNFHIFAADNHKNSYS